MKSQVFQIASFALGEHDRSLSAHLDQLKIHLLDSLGSCIFAFRQATIEKLKKQIESLSNERIASLNFPGSIDRAAQFYTALIRYPDFMDNYLGKEATCHPSDNIGALLAAGHAMNISGKEFLTAMGIAYEIECRLVEEVPVMIKGFDHTVLLAYSITAAVSRVLRLTEQQAANAIGIAGCTFNPLVTSRASYTTEWKGFASSMVALGCTNVVMLAKEDMTGPVGLFEMPEKGFPDIFGMKLEYDWSNENFELIRKCILKNYNAEVHTQPAIEAALELKQQYTFTVNDIEEINVTTFLTAYHIVGGGEYGDRMNVHSKEQADHSMPYLIAVALLDDDVYPAQLTPERIKRNDVQELLKKVKVKINFPVHRPVKVVGVVDKYTAAYPDKVYSEVTITLKDGKKLVCEKPDYKGFHTRPFSWNDVIEKFKRLTKGCIDDETSEKIIVTVREFEQYSVNDLINELQKIH